MAVYTEVAAEDLQHLLALYDIGAALSFKGIAEGVENSNFALDTGSGRFILTLYEKRVREEDLPFFLGLLEHLALRGVRCPVPVKCRDGRSWTILNGRPAAILTWLEGISLNRPDAEHCAGAAAALAELHDAGADFPLARRNGLGVSDWRTLAEKSLSRADMVQEGLAKLIETSLRDLESGWPSGLPQSVIHADLFPDNVLFIGNAVSGLIDFCFEIDGSYNVTKGGSLVAAYRARRRLEDAEIAAVPVLCAGAALRFLLTRLYDWLNPDPSALVRPKDPRAFAKRLAFHRKIRSVAEYGL